jgi:hypothetical protein
MWIQGPPHFPKFRMSLFFRSPSSFHLLGVSMAFVVMNIAKSYKIINRILTSVAVMFFMMELKHFPGVIW